MNFFKIVFVPVVVTLLISLFFQTGYIGFLYGLIGIMGTAALLTAVNNGATLGRLVAINFPEWVADKHFFTLRRLFWVAGTWVLYSSGFVFLAGIFSLWIFEGFIINLSYSIPEDED